MDLLALADTLLQPEDDLAVATVLKGPLFGLSEDDLFKLAHEREGSLWQAVQCSPDFAAQAQRLAAWKALARALSPFDFFAHILDAEGGRKAFAGRLGPECFEALDEFLNLAETFSARPLSSLAEFVSFARKSASEVKREMDQAAREVRIMTVHGAKGLEASIVILADCCGNKSAAGAPVYLLDDESGAPEIPVWAVKGTGGLPAVAAKKDEIKADEQRERGRLLYVAMTRPRDRLYIAGFHNGALPAGSWYETIQNALGGTLHEARDFQGRTVWRSGPAEEFHAAAETAKAAEEDVLPSWITSPAPAGRPHSVLSPSRLMARAGAEPAAEGHAAERERIMSRARGTLIHRLLEILPALDERHWPGAARLIASAFAGELSAAHREDAAGEVLSLLSRQILPRDGQHLPEAGLGMTVLDRGGRPIASILGQADRIQLHETSATVLDFKSGALSAGAGLRHNHLAQLACYRLALHRIYPGADIQAAILHTPSGDILQAAAPDLDEVLRTILETL
jgi:ATP-dependent helicase/nuclease subunit A